MSSRGLPGFLRRSQRVQYDEDETKTSNDGQEEPSSSSSSSSLVSSSSHRSDTAKVTTNAKTNDRSVVHTSSSDINNSNAMREKTLSEDTRTTLESTDTNISVLQQSRQVTSVPSGTTDSTAGEKNTLKIAPQTERVVPKRRPKPALSDSWHELPSPNVPVLTEVPPKTYKEIQIERVLSSSIVKLEDLRRIAWNGIPPANRALTWKLLLGYLPVNSQRRETTLQRKRSEYADAVSQHYNVPDSLRSVQEQETLRQVLVDVPRTQPTITLFRQEPIRRMLGRLLYVWAMRHPASSYVQGINDLATPLVVAFLADYYEGADCLDGHVLNHITPERLLEIEADVYGCLTNLLASIQDHYTADQPGLQRMVARLEELVQRIDADLCEHLHDTGIQFLQFSFKWMNCLLLREFSLPCVLRLWDTYLSEKNGFEDFHVYVCAAFLCQFSAQLQQMSFDELFVFMQNVPTQEWSDTEVEMLLSQAYVLSTLFGGSDAHLISGSNNIRR